MLKMINCETNQTKTYRTRKAPTEAQAGDLIGTCECGGDVVQLSEAGGTLSFGVCLQCGQPEIFEGVAGAFDAAVRGEMVAPAVGRGPRAAEHVPPRRTRHPEALQMERLMPDLGPTDWLFEPLPSSPGRAHRAPQAGASQAVLAYADKVARKAANKAVKKLKKQLRKELGC